MGKARLNNRQIFNTFTENNIRFEHMFLLGSAVGDILPHTLSEVLEDYEEEIASSLGIKSGSMSCTDELAFTLCRSDKMGFLAMVCTPVPKFSDDKGEDFSYCWSKFSFQWIYAETLEELYNEAVEWAKFFFDRKKSVHQLKVAA